MDDDIQTQEAATATETPVGVNDERVRQALMQVFDPELGINIVDLGLVYEIEVHDNGDVDIQYSLTTMGCPIGPLIEDQMRAFLAPIDGIGEVRPGAGVPARVEPGDDVRGSEGRARHLLTLTAGVDLRYFLHLQQIEGGRR